MATTPPIHQQTEEQKARRAAIIKNAVARLKTWKKRGGQWRVWTDEENKLAIALGGHVKSGQVTAVLAARYMHTITGRPYRTVLLRIGNWVKNGSLV
jgi:hypothetical protein